MEITLCPGFGCPRREACSRFVTAPGPVHHSFADFEAMTWGLGGCEYFSPVMILRDPSNSTAPTETVQRKPYPGKAA